MNEQLGNLPDNQTNGGSAPVLDVIKDNIVEQLKDQPDIKPFRESIPPLEFVEENLLAILLLVIWSLYLWEQYLSLRQRRLMQRLVELPKSLEGLLTTEDYEKSRSYALDKSTFSFIHELFSNVVNTIVMLYFGFYICWNLGEDIIQLLGLDKNNEILVSAGCIAVLMTISTILDIPFTIYSTFVLEERHGFNNQTALFFVRDQFVKFLVYMILLIPLMCGMIWIVKNGGNYFFFYLWIFTVVMSLLLMVLYPEVIAPLFDKYSPLPEGDLKNQIEALAASLKFPLRKIYMVDGSKRSSHSNAYLYGFHKNKRIVLFDTLVAEFNKEEKKDEDGQETSEVPKKPQRGCETDEIIAVLAHELGHWHHSHALKNFIFAQVSFVLNFLPFALLLNYKPLYVAFGFETIQPVLIGLLVVMMYVLAPLNTLVTWIMTANSRRYEFQADTFARKLNRAEPLRRALIKLHKDNLGYPLFDKLYSNWHHSHPPLLERLDALSKDD